MARLAWVCCAVLMSDHSGLSTTHAESPEAAAYRLALLMQMDCPARIATTSYTLIAEALDAFVQVGFDPGSRSPHH